MLLSEENKRRFKELAGILQEADRRVDIVQKLGLPEFVAKWAHDLSEKYSIWIANSFKNKVIQRLPPEVQRDLKSPRAKEVFAKEAEHQIETLGPGYQFILDWLRGRTGGAAREDDALNFRTLTYDEAMLRSNAWHQAIKKIQGGKIEDEDGEVLMTFPDGYYWIFLDKGYCEKEAQAMGHCGRGAGKLYSLRKEQVPFVTADISNDGVIMQMRGRANTKPKAKYHPYILKFIKDPQIGIKYFGYNSYKDKQNFRLEDITKAELNDILKEKPLLLKNQNFGELDLSDSTIDFLLKNHPEVFPHSELIKVSDFSEIENMLMNNDKFVTNSINDNKFQKLISELANYGGKWSKLAADALYKNKIIRNHFLENNESGQHNYYRNDPITQYVTLLKSTGPTGIAYMNNLGIKTDSIKDAYLKQNNPDGYIQLLLKSDLFGRDGIVHASTTMRDPKFKKDYIKSMEPAGEDSYNLTLQFIEEMMDTNLSEGKTIKDIAASTIYEHYIADDSKINDVANRIAQANGYSTDSPLIQIGSGYRSIAFDLGNGKVLKISRDINEAINNNKLIGKKLDYVANVDLVCSVNDSSAPSLELYAIVQEKTEQPDIISNAWDELTNQSANSTLGLRGLLNKEQSEENKISLSEEALKLLNDLINAKQELEANGIKNPDLQSENIGYKDGKYSIIELGTKSDGNDSSIACQINI